MELLLLLYIKFNLGFDNFFSKIYGLSGFESSKSVSLKFSGNKSSLLLLYDLLCLTLELIILILSYPLGSLFKLGLG